MLLQVLKFHLEAAHITPEVVDLTLKVANLVAQVNPFVGFGF